MTQTRSTLGAMSWKPRLDSGVPVARARRDENKSIRAVLTSPRAVRIISASRKIRRVFSVWPRAR